MAYSPTSIEIVLITELSKSHVSKKDDVVRIRKDLDTNEFQLTYTEQSKSDKPIVHRATNLYREKVSQYVYLLLKNQHLDDEGYQHVQINIPAMPCIIMSASKINEVYCRDHINELILTGLDLLDVTEVVSSNVNKAAKTSVSRGSNYYSSDYEYNTPAPTRRSTAPDVVPQHLFWDE
jgi:hypothetical protein